MPFLGENEFFVPSKTENQKKRTKQTKKNKKTNKEGLGPSEVALRATSPDP